MENKTFEPVAKEILTAFEEIERRAVLRGREAGENPSDSLAGGNTFTGAAAFDSIRRAHQANKDGYKQLEREPAIARIVLASREGEKKVFYIARSTVFPLKGINLASYHSPIGRYAELPIGDEETVEIGDKKLSFTVLEKAELYPQQPEGEWDSRDTVFRLDDEEVFTLPSLLALLAGLEAPADDELDRLLEKEALSGNIKRGVRHQIRTAIALRDQPILDRFQGNIFRLPINRQLLILGPPGTGKTTTLIKRLGQKLNITNLAPQEQRYIENKLHAVPYERSWLMFTPSDLLKQYLKEAFSREGVPASDANITTWSIFRNDAARNVLGILRSSNGGRFNLDTALTNIKEPVARDPREFFNSLSEFHEARIRSDLKGALDDIVRLDLETLQDTSEVIATLSTESDNRSLIDLFRSIESVNEPLRNALESLNRGSTRIIKEQRNILYNTNPDAFHKLAEKLEFDGAESQIEEDEDSEDLIGSTTASETDAPLHRAVASYVRALRVIARNRYKGRSVSQGSRAAHVFEIIGGRFPDQDVMLELGRLLFAQSAIRKLIRGIRRYVLDVPATYAQFRRAPESARFVLKDKNADQNAVSETELDLIVSLMTRNSRELLKQGFIQRNIESRNFDWLGRLSSLQRIQVFVDEATDFSLLQLAAIEALASPDSNSFFACGDFNQRITAHGVQTKAQISWISRDIEQRAITTVYRQSRRLNDFAKILIDLMDGDRSAVGELSTDSAHEGVEPALLEHSYNIHEVASWISDRIREVEKGVDRMPSIAVLVDHESEVEPMSDALTQALRSINLRASPCLRGQILGQQSDVRVFDVQHIKGLEFEAVFFVGVDRLAVRNPELFIRFLYVGATRAATYLGLVCYESFPEAISLLRAKCTGRW